MPIGEPMPGLLSTPIAGRATRRLVTVDGPDGRSRALADGPVDDVLLDPARPGFSCTRIWSTDRTPAVALTSSRVLEMARSLAPPPGGSVFWVVVLPPDAGWLTAVTRADVEAFFRAAGSPEACCFAADAPHPYLQRIAALELCVVLEGEPVLVLDTGPVALGPTDTVVQRATRHAWSNPTSVPCVLAISSHDATAPNPEWNRR